MVTIWVNLAAHAAPATAEVVVVALPAGEDPDLWRNAFALAGLRAGKPAAAGPGAELTVQGGAWKGWVRDEHGVVHALSVTPPTDRAGREALAALIASLARPVRSMPMVALPPVPVPVPPPPRPRPVPVEPAPVLPEAPVVVVPPPPPLSVVDVLAPLAVSSEELFAPEVYETRAWFGGGPVLKWRPAYRTAAGVSVWGGVAREGAPVGWRVGLGVEGMAPAALIRLGEPMGSADLVGLAGVTTGRWDAGALAGPSARWFPNPSLHPNVVWIATFGGTVGYSVPVGATDLRVGVGLGGDVGRVEVCPPEDACPTPRTSLAVNLQLLRR